MTQQNDDGISGAASWFKNNPLWLLIMLFAGIGTPTSIGSAIWLNNNEARFAIYEANLKNLSEEVAELKATLKGDLGVIQTELGQRSHVKELAGIQMGLSEIRADLSTRVTTRERLEMLAGLERSIASLERRMDRLEVRTWPARQPDGSGAGRPYPDETEGLR